MCLKKYYFCRKKFPASTKPFNEWITFGSHGKFIKCGTWHPPQIDAQYISVRFKVSHVFLAGNHNKFLLTSVDVSIQHDQFEVIVCWEAREATVKGELFLPDTMGPFYNLGKEQYDWCHCDIYKIRCGFYKQIWLWSEKRSKDSRLPDTVCHWQAGLPASMDSKQD